MKSLQKVFDLITKTGDRCIVVSEELSEVYAIMSLKEYERIMLGKAEVADLTEDELLDRINRDIAVWKSQQQEEQDTEVEIPESPEFEQDLGLTDIELGDNLANNSKNYQGWSDWDEDTEEDDFEEEPYYFEKA